nr:hypothetical protein [Clostridia bacterium]
MAQIKNIMIFGDSYSTFRDYIPKGYAAYYSPDETDRTDVRKVEETWWHRLCSDMSLNLVLNNSWSGSTLCNTGYNGDCSKTSSFICRLNKLIDEGFFADNTIDTVLIFGCTNDSWANSPLGELKFSDFDDNELFSVPPAIGYFAAKLKATLPEANIVYIVNTDLKPEISEAMAKTAEHFGIGCIKLENVDKRNGHPTIKGMGDIKEQVEAYLTK